MYPLHRFPEIDMSKLSIPDMSCGHCVGVITKTVKALDADAQLDFDLAQHTVTLQTKAPLDAVRAALDDAGYPATPA
jgi:copper chaperone